MLNEAPVIAYPIDNSPSRRSNSNIMEENVYSSSIGDSKFADDTIEMSGNFFSQLDSMIAAVKVESSALDSMKEKLKEVENLRNQISNFTKRLLDADQANLNLKANLVKVQEMYAEIKKSKAEVESSIVPLRAELNRTKDQCNKERAGRVNAQQQVAQMKDQIAMLEAANENMDREVKTIPALSESNEILKNDLAQVRRRHKDEKAQMAKHIKHLESQASNVESIKGAVRELSMKLLELSSGGAGATSSSSSVQGQVLGQLQGQVQGGLNPNSAAYIAQQQQLRMQQQMQQQQQQQRYGQAPSNAPSYYTPQYNSSAQQQHMHHQQQQQQQLEDEDNDYNDEEEEESGDYDDDAGGGAGGAGGAGDYENESFVQEVNSSIESVGSVALIGKGPVSSAGGAGKVAGGSGGKKKKKVVRKVAPQQQQGGAGAGGNNRPIQQQQQQPRMMQQLDGGNNSGALQQQQQQQMYQQPQQYRGAIPQQQQLQQSFSLPRI